MIQPDLRATIRVLAVVPVTLACFVFVSLAAGCLISDWNARRVPPRSYRNKPLGEVIQDWESHGVIPIHSVWESETLKSIPVTLEIWRFPSDREAVEILAKRTGVVIAYPMDQHGGVEGPLHIRRASDRAPGVERFKVERFEGPVYAADRLPTPRAGTRP